VSLIAKMEEFARMVSANAEKCLLEIFAKLKLKLQALYHYFYLFL
jgi:hypothetical protein